MADRIRDVMTPNPKTGNKSRNVRILEFTMASKQVTAEYVYRFEPAY